MEKELLTAFQLQQVGQLAEAARIYKAVLARTPYNADALHLFGVLHHQAGHAARAVELIRRAVALRPNAAAFHANLAEAYRALGQHERAVDSGRTALRLQPNFPEAANNLGLALQALGRRQEAAEQFGQALRLRPQFAMAQNNLGSLLNLTGQLDEALTAFRAAVALEPGLAMAQANLGQLLVNRGQAQEALPHCLEAVRLSPQLGAAHNNLGNAYCALGKLAEACAAFTEAIRLSPQSPRFHANLALTLKRDGKPAEALRAFERAAELGPDDPEMWQNLAAAHAGELDFANAIPCFERVVALQPEQAPAHSDLGWVLQEDGRHPEAFACYRRALELDPGHLGTLVNQGILQEEVGQMAEAEASYRQACKIAPEDPAPLARLTMLLRGKLSEEEHAAVLKCLEKPSTDEQPTHPLLFGLAHFHEGRGEYAEAAGLLQRANALALEHQRKQGHAYDPAQHSGLVTSLINEFTPELFHRLAGAAASETRLPVFVFGLPRSGTTLVEQVLASHSRVHGAGELRLAHHTLQAMIIGLGGNSEGQVPSLATLDSGLLQQLHQQHIEGLQAILQRLPPGTNRDRVVDKMPDNYLFLGLLALLFPQAAFIHVRRDLRDVAVSCWMTNFRSIRWACDPDHIAARFHEYERLSAHWRKVLPVPVHEVTYERLVDDLEGEARRLVAACGLEWEPACLDFHRTARPVRTASVTQVRQPLYRKALARWRHYEQHLADLFARLPLAETSSAGRPGEPHHGESTRSV
jgi:tetratricopeptide (TPR) repeat protein